MAILCWAAKNSLRGTQGILHNTYIGIYMLNLTMPYVCMWQLTGQPAHPPPPNQSYDVGFPPFVSLIYTLPPSPPPTSLQLSPLPSPPFPPFVSILHITRHIA